MKLIDLPEFKPIETASVGSQVICRPKPKESDHDYLFLVSDLKKDTNYLISKGWNLGTGSQDQNWGKEWVSLKKTYTEEKQLTKTSKISETWIENFILTDNPILFDRFVRACAICRALNLKKKQDRIIVHQAIMYEAIDLYGILDS